MRPHSITNREAHRFTTTRSLFKGANLYSANIGYLYAVFSYSQAYPLYVYANGKWYENSDKSTQATERHRRDARPDGVTAELRTTVQLRTMLHEAIQPASAVAPAPALTSAG